MCGCWAQLKMSVRPAQQAVGLEGLFGVLLIIIAMPILHLLFAAKSDYFDIPLGYRQIINDPKIAGISAAICVSIALFNLSGLSVTRAVSASARLVQDDTCLIHSSRCSDLRFGVQIYDRYLPNPDHLDSLVGSRLGGPHLAL